MALVPVAAVPLIGLRIGVEALASVRADGVGARGPQIMAHVRILIALVNVRAVGPLEVEMSERARRLEAEALEARARETRLQIDALRVGRAVIRHSSRQRSAEAALVHVSAVRAVAPVAWIRARAVVRTTDD